MTIRKKIWIINQYSTLPDNGMGGRSYYFAKELAKKGHSVNLIAASYHHMIPTPVEQKDVLSKRWHKGFDFVTIKTPMYSHAHSLLRVSAWFLFMLRLRLLIKFLPESPDLILVSTPSVISYLGAEYLARKTKAELVWDLRDPWPATLIELGGKSPAHPFIKFLQWVEDRACRNSNKVMSNSPLMINHVASRGVSADSFEWIPNGFSKSEFEASMPLSKEFLNKIPLNKFIVTYVGTLGMANATDVLLDVAERMKGYHDVLFLVVGGGKDSVEFESEIIDRNLGNVLYMGRVEKQQVPTVLGLADCCYVGFRKNPLYRLGSALNKLPEYLASKKPIIYSITSPFKPVDDAGAGITVDAEDVEGIVSAILSLKGMPPSEREKLGQSGYNYAIANHDYESLSGKLDSFLFSDDHKKRHSNI